MKQIIQSLRNGETILEDIPVPVCKRGFLLIQTTHSLVSLGTEKMLVGFGQANLLEKARQQPEKVKQVVEKVKAEGFLPTMQAVFNKLEQPIPLGYCNVGIVKEIGEGVIGFKIGDRVASNGPHAEFVCVPQNLAVSIPNNVTSEEAAFTVIGSIGLQGIRLSDPALGETIVVIGMGLIGLITVQLLKANGCKVIGVDIDDEKLALAKGFGIHTFNNQQGDVVKWVHDFTDGFGADAVIITASTKSNDIVSQAARMSRKRGRIILVGVVGLELNRAEFYEKELTFQVSCSYGPGRYDDAYEKRGLDYPLPFVRWTERRNFEAVLNAISTGSVNVKLLITERYPLLQFENIYNNIGKSKSIACILEYASDPLKKDKHTIKLNNKSFAGQKGVVGIIGAGNFTKMTVLPALKRTSAVLKSIASESGVTGTALARKYGFQNSTTHYSDILNDPDIDLVMITTRHNVHAEQVVRALESGKHVFVEKPLALNEDELQRIVQVYQRVGSLTLNVGFNRRFSPHSVRLKEVLGSGAINIVATMNAGFIPADVWIHDPLIGGGRIIGEACHLIDLCSFFTGSKVQKVCMNATGIAPTAATDNASILLRYANGSNAVINYFSNGSKAYSKERIEIYSHERTAVIDNFRTTKAFGFSGLNSVKTGLDKGHQNQFAELMLRVKNGGAELIPFETIINTTRASFAAIESLLQNKWIDVTP